MIIKCKMCGGDIDFTPGATYGTCEYCGSTSTIPRAEDEQKLNRYNRANHFRRQCEFDKALSAYEKILEQDDTDAEAHWGAVLSRYGIEYVEDPATGKRIPTCHRVQIASILADADYLAAVENAPDGESRRLYEEQAAQIADIQKGILAISASEKPYDVFICYKETDESGQRTRDSQWAQDVYYGLTDAGYKVFFSRITLEDKLGQQYEPYIFAALNSAKVMVVIGSKPEYFSAVWVKNEWSRYLSLMAGDRKRLLIPCYRDMDPYDLPEELSNLQSQDMSKIGFMQDLLRGVKKVLDADKTEDAPHVVQQVVQSSGEMAAPGVSSLMRRAALFLEDGDFQSASEYLDRVLDYEPEYAPAYLSKVCVDFHLRNEKQLGQLPFVYEDNANWQKALRFANPQQRAVYEDYLTPVKERVKGQILSYAMDCAIEMAVSPDANRETLDQEYDSYQKRCLHSEKPYVDGSRRRNAEANEQAFLESIKTGNPADGTEQGLNIAAQMFEAINEPKALEYAKHCRTLAEQARQRNVYNQADSIAQKAWRYLPKKLEKAASIFAEIPSCKDAQQRQKECLDRAEAIRNQLYNDAVSLIDKVKKGDALWFNRWGAVIYQLSNSNLEGYRDVAELLRQAKEQQAREQQREAEAAAKRKKRTTVLALSFTAAVIAIILLVTKVFIPKSHYDKALQFRANGQWEEAVAAFAEAGDYSDAANQITETHYQHAQSLMKADDYNQAYAVLLTLKGYADVDAMLANDKNLFAAARKAMFAVGNYVTFGTYPQTAEGNDETPIEWLVLDRDGDKALLLSHYGLDAQPYNEKYEDITWEKCTLRTWLNNDFMNRAFTEAEQSAILLTNVDNSSSQGYSRWSTNGGNNTQDKLFLLSYAEANKYLGVTYDDSNNMKSRVAPTAYAIAQGVYTSDSNKTAEGQAAWWWWLRSPGRSQDYAAYVNTDGFLNYIDADHERGSVRPALWVNIESGIF